MIIFIYLILSVGLNLSFSLVSGSGSVSTGEILQMNKQVSNCEEHNSKKNSGDIWLVGSEVIF